MYVTKAKKVFIKYLYFAMENLKGENYETKINNHNV